MKEFINRILDFILRRHRIEFMRMRMDAKLPEKASKGSAAYDAYTPHSVKLKLGMQIVPLGWALQQPECLSVDCRPRSGYTAKGLLCYDKNGEELRLVNSTIVELGLIDSDYRGEIGVILWVGDYRVNLMDLYLHKHQALAQLKFNPVPRTRLKEVRVLSSTERGSNGFGAHNGE